jgi:hypothetical protein
MRAIEKREADVDGLPFTAVEDRHDCQRRTWLRAGDDVHVQGDLAAIEIGEDRDPHVGRRAARHWGTGDLKRCLDVAHGHASTQRACSSVAAMP